MSTLASFTQKSLPSFTKQDSGTVQPLDITDMFALPVTTHHDTRGFFVELGKIPSLNAARQAENSATAPFVIKQLNHAHSKQFVARGFHAEDWNKLVTVTSGLCFVAIADIREHSETYGTVITGLIGPSESITDYTLPEEALTIDFQSRLQSMPIFTGSIFLPKGVANSVCVLSESIDYLYAVDALYEERDPAGDTAVSLFDPTINVSWPIETSRMVISQRDTDTVELSQLIKNQG